MNGLTNFQAFLAGLLIGVILPIIFLQIRKILPTVKKRSQIAHSQRVGARDKDIELKIKQYMLRKCQSNHLLSFTCPFNEIYVDINLLSQNYYTQPGDFIENEPSLFQILPPIADFPELSSLLPAPKISIKDAVRSQWNIAIKGEIGSGKTTLLSHFCSELLAETFNEARLDTLIPLFFHVRELSLKSSAEDLFDTISNAISFSAPTIEKSSVRRFIERLVQNDQLILIIDGLDELNSTEFDEISDAFRRISIVYPRIQLLTAIGSHYTSSLAQAGFAFCTMPSPDQRFRDTLRKNLLSKLSSATGDNDTQSMENILSLWDNQFLSAATPGQITLQILSVFSGNSQLLPVKVGFLQDLFTDVVIVLRLRRIANKIYLGKNQPLEEEVVRQMLGDPISENVDSKNQLSIEELDKSKTKQGERSDSYSDLLTRGILRKFDNNIFAFSNPLIYCELLFQSNSLSVKEDARNCLRDPISDYLLKYSPTNFAYLQNWLKSPSDPLRSNIVINACRHLVQKSKTDQNENAKLLISLVCDPQLAFSVKLKLFHILAWQYGANIDRIFEFINNKTSDKQLINRLLAIALFYLPTNLQENTFTQVINSIDPVAQILAAIWYLFQRKNQTADNILAFLNWSNDSLVMLIMELMALKTPADSSLFSEIRVSNSIKLRKAVVHGLRFVREAWANELLNLILSEDDQWIVRDAVSHALESPWENRLVIPAAREKPNQSSWLLQQASLRGLGIPANQFPEELILDIVKQGNLEEKLVALGYLEDFPTKSCIRTLQELSQVNNPLQEPALSSLNRLFLQKRFFDLLI